MIRPWVLIGPTLAGMVTVVALAWMGQLVRGQQTSAGELYRCPSGGR